MNISAIIGTNVYKNKILHVFSYYVTYIMSINGACAKFGIFFIQIYVATFCNRDTPQQVSNVYKRRMPGNSAVFHTNLVSYHVINILQVDTWKFDSFSYLLMLLEYVIEIPNNTWTMFINGRCLEIGQFFRNNLSCYNM